MIENVNEPNAEDYAIANLTDEQISNLALDAARHEKSQYANQSIINQNSESFIRDYAKAIVIFKGYRNKAQAKVQAYEKMISSKFRSFETAEPSIEPTVDYEDIRTIEGYYGVMRDNSLNRHI